MEVCLFCRIVAGELAAHRVLDDEHAVAFLDHRPLFPGHVLVVPRQHVVTLPDLPSAEIGPFFERVQALARAVPLAMESDGSFVANNNIVSQSVAHLHVHVVPRTQEGRSARLLLAARTRYADDEQMTEVAARITASIRTTR